MPCGWEPQAGCGVCIPPLTRRGRPGPGGSPAVHGDGVVARLLLLLLHSRDEVDHAFALGRNPDLGPAVEVELADHAGLLLLVGQGLWAGEGVSVHAALTIQEQTYPPREQGPGLGSSWVL